MEPAFIVFIVLLGGYTSALLYLNARVRTDQEPPGGGVEEPQRQPASQLNDLLKTGVSAGGVAILGLLGMMVLMALLCVYALLFDPHLLE
jgi:hypothetical protein